jgi:hypothetical protein
MFRVTQLELAEEAERQHRADLTRRGDSVKEAKARHQREVDALTVRRRPIPLVKSRHPLATRMSKVISEPSPQAPDPLS